MNSSWTIAQSFLAELSEEEKNRLYNDLLMIEKVHQKNQFEAYYSLRKLRRASHRLFDDRKKTFRYITNQEDELVIQQIQEQRLLKTRYSILIRYNGDELGYVFVEELLVLLKEAELELSTV